MSRVEEEEGAYPSSPMNWRIQMISLAASTAAIYSASVCHCGDSFSSFSDIFSPTLHTLFILLSTFFSKT
jgi:hypothetical protein